MERSVKRAKPLRDVRYFESPEHLRPGSPMPGYAGELFKLPKDAIALGQRIGRKCEELGISIGDADHLYVCLTPCIPEASLLHTDYALERWHRFVMVGLASNYSDRPVGEQLSVVQSATFGAIAALATRGVELLPLLQQEMTSKGSALRVTLRTKETKKYRIRVEQDIPVHPTPSRVFARIEELATSRALEVQVAQVRFHDDVPSLVDRLSLVDEVLTIHPRKSFRAELIGRDYELPLKVSLRELVEPGGG